MLLIVDALASSKKLFGFPTNILDPVDVRRLEGGSRLLLLNIATYR